MMAEVDAAAGTRCGLCCSRRPRGIPLLLLADDAVTRGLFERFIWVLIIAERVRMMVLKC